MNEKILYYVAGIVTLIYALIQFLSDSALMGFVSLLIAYLFYYFAKNSQK